MLTETTERLVDKTITTTTTVVSFADFASSPNEVLKIGVSISAFTRPFSRAIENIMNKNLSNM